MKKIFLLFTVCSLLFTLSCSQPITRTECDIIANTLSVVAKSLCVLVTVNAALKANDSLVVSEVANEVLHSQIFIARSRISSYLYFNSHASLSTTDHFLLHNQLRILDSLSLSLTPLNTHILND